MRPDPSAIAKRLCTWAVTLSTLVTPLPCGAEIDLAELTRETQRQSQQEDVTQVVQWIPADVWDVAMRQQGTPETVRAARVAAITPYVVFLVGEVRIGPAGGIGYATAAELAKRTRLSLGEKMSRREPTPLSNLPEAVRDFVDSIVPAASDAANFQLHALVFDGLGERGAPLTDPRKPGRLTLAVGERRYTWRLPLGALLPEKSCPVDGEVFPGSYGFCPFHGDRLIDRDPKADAREP